MFGSDGPFVIKNIEGPNSYSLQRYGRPSSALQKFSGNNLYLLPKQIFPSDPFDSSDQRFLNRDWAPLQHPLSDSYGIESYNVAWYDDAPETTTGPFIDQLALAAATPHSTIPLLAAFDNDVIDPSSCNAGPLPLRIPTMMREWRRHQS